MKFSEVNFEYEVLDGIESMGFEEMTPVQEQTIPFILENKDVIACAQTGTGKTAAFMLPVLNQLCRTPEDHKIKALVVVPTRELAIQIEQQIQGFAYYLGISSVSVYGGNDSGIWNVQRKALESGVDVVVSTPGRLMQHLSLKYVDLKSVEHFILDEADRMLDMGFYDDIMTISSFLPEKKQTLMFSATMPSKIRTLARKLLTDPIEVSIAISKPAEGILQVGYSVYDNQKIPLIKSLLEGKNLQSVIIFSSTKSSVKDITRELRRNGFKAAAIHSDLDQAEREEVMRKFKNRTYPLVVATDILSRGIDVDGIDMVLNYNVPSDPEDYVHRIGRTARAKSEGTGVTFISPKEQPLFQRIEELIEKEIFKAPLPPELGEAPAYNPGQNKGGSGKGRFKKNFSGKSGGDKQRNRKPFNKKQGPNRPPHKANHPGQAGNKE